RWPPAARGCPDRRGRSRAGARRRAPGRPCLRSADCRGSGSRSGTAPGT
nr:hypothetical protein [Tanacetum cinerariifolium]